MYRYIDCSGFDSASFDVNEVSVSIKDFILLKNVHIIYSIK